MSIGEYFARCHCGSVTARYRTALPVSAWSVRACQCDFCRTHNALSTSDPSGFLSFQASDPERVQRYRFGTRTTEFMLCRECGVYVGARIETDKGRFGILNIVTLMPLLAGVPGAQPMNYGAEAAEEKRMRREALWTPLAADSI